MLFRFLQVKRQAIMEGFQDPNDDEQRLAEQFKNCLDEDLKKEGDAKKTAEIIHKIGKLYRRRSPDKLSLIKSVGLFNAAIARNPSNISDVKSDLAEICHHILKEAKAIKRDADLVKKAQQLKTSITKMRSKVKAYLHSEVPKIPTQTTEEHFQKLKSKKITAIQTINRTIADKYTKIMANVCKYCEKVMGNPPCKYAIAGMGSLARKEITPYSDFEHVIVLNDRERNYRFHLEYFRWFTVIFQVVILNLQESIIPSLNVCSFPDSYYDCITPRGISFDGMMPHACKFPLGRGPTANKPLPVELIKPVGEMLEYLTSDADLKNGYHLADILTKTCFVFGAKDVYDEFEKGAQHKRAIEDIRNSIKQQVKDDLNNFSARFRLNKIKSEEKINIKKIVYRCTTIFITALGSLHNITEKSCFEIIEKMKKDQKLTPNTAEKLKYAIAIACEFRLRVYIKNKSQCDEAIDPKQDGMKKFLNVVGVVCTINYFQIAYCLQCAVAKQLHFTKLHFYNDSKLINFTIGMAFGINFLTVDRKDPQERLWDLQKFNFDVCIKQLESESLFNSSTDTGLRQRLFEMIPVKFLKYTYFTLQYHIPDVSKPNSEQIEAIAERLRSAKLFDEALDFFRQLLESYENVSKDITRDLDIAWTSNQIGLCLHELQQPKDAVEHLERTFAIRTKVNATGMEKANAETLDMIGACHIDLQQYDLALINLTKSLEIYQAISLDNGRNRKVALTLQSIGRCHSRMHQHNEALTYLDQALETYRNTTARADMDKDIAKTFHDIAFCHIDLHHYQEAYNHLTRALEIYQYTLLDVNKDRDLALTQKELGLCQIGLRQYQAAWNCLEQCLQIFQNTTLDEEKDRYIADTYYNMGECLIADRQQYLHAQPNFEQAIKIYETITLQKEKDVKIAEASFSIGICQKNFRKYREAIASFKKSLDIYQKLSTCEHNLKMIITIRAEMDKCKHFLR